MAFKAIALAIDGLIEKAVRENFQLIAKYLSADPFAKGRFRFIEIPVGRTGALEYPHLLGFRPTDVITLSVAKPSTATITWTYDAFTRETITLYASGPCTVRAYIGSYKE